MSTGRAIRRSHALITTLIFHHWTRIVRNLPSEQETRFLCVVVCLYVAVSARALHAIHMGVAEGLVVVPLKCRCMHLSLQAKEGLEMLGLVKELLALATDHLLLLRRHLPR